MNAGLAEMIAGIEVIKATQRTVPAEIYTDAHGIVRRWSNKEKFKPDTAIDVDAIICQAGALALWRCGDPEPESGDSDRLYGG